MVARERIRSDVQRRRVNFELARRFVPRDKLLWLDETGVRTHMTRRHGRSRGGSRCIDHEPAGRWTSRTLLGVVRESGLVRGASLLLEGAMNGVVFLKWVKRMLVPNLEPGDVVVMDNLSSHKVAGVAAAIEKAGASVWYLPPYSPDRNPIEGVWSQVKATLRRLGAGEDDLEQAVAAALDAVTPEHCRNHAIACGYTTER